MNEELRTESTRAGGRARARTQNMYCAVANAFQRGFGAVPN
jgi:hypothetical protein